MKNFAQMQKVLLGSVSALAISAMVGPALAQEAGIETVVVTGIRASLTSAQSIKQNSDQMVDSITSVDIGALPDRSVAEALQRVPGIQITRTDQNRDPVRWAGFGQGVFIRGLSWVQALTNGHSTFGAENGRTISFGDVSSSLMAGVDVYKNPNAKMIEGGVGGTVDLRTRKPFDQEGQLIAFSVSDDLGDINEKFAPAANALYSNRWNTSIGEIGALVSADFQDLRAGNNVYSLGVYDGGPTTLTDGTVVRYPQSDAVSYRHMDWQQKRVAFYGAFQWRPNDKLEIGLTGIYTKADPTSIEHVITWGLPTDSASLNSYGYDSVGTWKSGTINNAQNIWGGQDTRYGVRHHVNIDASLNLKYNPSDALAITADVQYTEARASMYDMTMYTKQMYNGWYNWGNGGAQLYPGAPVINVTANFAGDVPSISYAGDVAGLATKADYVWGAAMDHLENNYAHNWTARADLSYTFGQNGVGSLVKSLDFGFRADLREAVTRQSIWNWVGMNYQTWYIWTGASTANILDWAGDISTKAPDAAELYKFGTFFGKTPPSMWMPKASLVAKGGNAIWSVFSGAENGWNTSGTWVSTWRPLAVAAGCTTGPDYYCNTIYTHTTPGSTSQTAGVNSPTEDTYAGYLQLNYGHDTFLGTDVPIDGNIGIRIVQTQDESGPGYFLYPSLSGCGASTDDLLGACNFVGTGGGSLTEPVASVNHTYTDILPSFNFRARLTDQVQVRLAFSQQVVRPDFAFTQNYTTLGFAFQTGLNSNFFRASGGRTGQGGNPNLKPLHANNYDASIEWYFAPTGSLSFALFHKDITDYFMTATAAETYTHGSPATAETFQVQRYYNGGKGRVEGFELAYQQFYDSLPGAWGGLGLQANYTKIYNKGGANPSWNITSPAGSALAADTTLPMEGMSNDSYNLALMYEKYGISGRVAYNWRSGFLMTTSAANLNQPVWQDKFGQLDGSLFYTILDHYKIGIQATNILKASTFLDVGLASYHPRYEWVESDRKLSVVLRASW